jgi:hypothetical protein
MGFEASGVKGLKNYRTNKLAHEFGEAPVPSSRPRGNNDYCISTGNFLVSQYSHTTTCVRRLHLRNHLYVFESSTSTPTETNNLDKEGCTRLRELLLAVV